MSVTIVLSQDQAHTAQYRDREHSPVVADAVAKGRAICDCGKGDYCPQFGLAAKLSELLHYVNKEVTDFDDGFMYMVESAQAALDARDNMWGTTL